MVPRLSRDELKRANRCFKRTRRLQQEKPRLFDMPAAWSLLPPAQDPHGRGFWLTRARRVCVVAANRVGKTTTAIRRLAKEMVQRPGTRWRIVAPTTAMLAKNRAHGHILYQSVKDQLDPGSNFKVGRGWNNNVCILRNGSTCELTSYEQDPLAHAGVSLDGVLLDEPPLRAHFEEAEARVFDTGGVVWVTLTAVGRPVKWFRTIVEDGVELARETGGEDGWVFFQVGLSKANCPWFSTKMIESRKRLCALSPSTYEQRINGAWEGVSDERWFSCYTDRNVVPTLDQGWASENPLTYVLSVDHGELAQHTVWILYAFQVITAADGRRRLCVRVIAEWGNPSRMTPEREAASVKRMIESAGLRLSSISWAVGDTNSAGRASETATSLNELFEAEFRRLGGAFKIHQAAKGPDSKDLLTIQVNHLLDQEVNEVPCLTIHVGCTRVNETLSHWAGRDDDLKHAGDSLRYGIGEIIRRSRYQAVELRR